MGKIYYYVHTGHRFGLNRYRKAVAIIEMLSDYEITLLTSDYRIASGSRDFGINGAIGIDVFRNIPNIAEYGDILFYDSTEENEAQLDGMIEFFSKFIRVTDDPNYLPRKGEYVISPYLKGSEFVLNANPISEKFFTSQEEKSIEKALFFGDDDYDKDLLRYFSGTKIDDVDLLLGFYFFFGYEDELGTIFSKVWENEDYDEVVKKSKILITSSTQTALSSLACGGKPIFIERSDRDSNSQELLKSFGIPVLEEFSLENINNVIEKTSNYAKLQSDRKKIVDFFKQFL
jgi:hypothetical protein